MRHPPALRDRRGAIRLPSAEMILGTHLNTLPYRNHPYLPEHCDSMPRSWRDIVRHDPCAWCGHPGSESATVDHVVTRADGGSDHWDNLVGACRACNNERGASTVLQYLAKRACLDRLRRGSRVPLATIWDLVRARAGKRVRHRR